MTASIFTSNSGSTVVSLPFYLLALSVEMI